MIFGTPLSLQGVHGLTPGSRVILHDCRPLRENAPLVHEFLRATGIVDVLSKTANAEGERKSEGQAEGSDEDRELQEALAAFRQSDNELWESAAFRQIVEAWRKELYQRSAGGDVLEIGVGRGRGLRNPAWKTWCSSYTGVDVSLHEDARRTAETLAASPSHRRGAAFPLVDLVESDAHNLPLPGDSFDSVLSHRVLCCVASPSTVISSLLRVVRSGGSILLFEHGSLHPAVAEALEISAVEATSREDKARESGRSLCSGATAAAETRREGPSERFGKRQEAAHGGREKHEVERREREGGRGASAAKEAAKRERNVDWEKMFPLPPEALADAIASLQIAPRSTCPGEGKGRRKETGACAWIDALGETIKLADRQERREHERSISFSREGRATQGDKEATEERRALSGRSFQSSSFPRPSPETKKPVIEEVHIFVAPRPETERSWTAVRCVAVRC
ncbi:putative methyltransferase domain containing protein [Neospora caninum Liverpool]|nr:putative methyltransferase domain containing protein [Neospora caninum Liverpool]CBZ56092.1 putative methyltransferase domain containing protein [Neospora caninum Liverpool]|eukprot:XP_003886118.1 putative methyltransferase domain containing protein [Neospora caninum Liverpool]